MGYLMAPKQLLYMRSVVHKYKENVTEQRLTAWITLGVNEIHLLIRDADVCFPSHDTGLT